MIGERLEEARKRKGVSIREAAEATKIRGDYLLAMEDNSFSIALPQIYIRGFLKNYARFLSLDPNKLLTDYDAHLLGKKGRSPVSRSGRESLGHMEIPYDEQEEAEAEEERVVITEAPEQEGPDPEMRFNIDRKPETRAAPPPPTLDREPTTHDQESWNENKTLYIKIGIIFAAIILVAIILVAIIRMIGGSGDTPEINPDLASGTPASTQPIQTAPTMTPDTTSGPDKILVTASDNVTLIVEQIDDRRRLYSGTLNAGETLSLDKEGPVSIRFTNGAAIVIEKDGQQFTPSQTGVGRTRVE
ncbi:MAG: helix-turn-helix domain-containing protein [Puniceicoccaceae bacterium]